MLTYVEHQIESDYEQAGFLDWTSKSIFLDESRTDKLTKALAQSAYKAFV